MPGQTVGALIALPKFFTPVFGNRIAQGYNARAMNAPSRHQRPSLPKLLLLPA